MKLKDGISVFGISPEILLALVIADSIIGKLSVEGMTVTEVTGGKHKAGSLHYVGLSADIRIRDFGPTQVKQIVEELSLALGKEYDVVLEDDHIHVEFQPK